MNEEVLKQLASKWLRDAKPPEIVSGAEEDRAANALAKGIRIGFEKCAGDLLSIVKLLGEQP